MSKFEQQFEAAMFNIYKRAKNEAGYTANVFLQMLTDRGGLETARFLINQPKPSDGYTNLFERGRLDLTVEALVIEGEKWHVLFTPDELEKALNRLTQYGYTPRPS